MSVGKFGIQFSSLSGQIQVGRINKAGIEFTAHEYQTNPAVWAVAQYVLKQMGGEMWITDPTTGKRLDISVSESESVAK